MQISIPRIENMPEYEAVKIQQLIDTFNYHENKNKAKQKYYEGAVTLSDVNLGIALPQAMRNLTVGCEWGAKAVDVLASRSMFDGFVNQNGTDNEDLTKIIDKNNFISQYMKACKDQLKFGCTFATLSADPDAGCKIRFHSPQTASALWDGEKGRIECGMAIIDTVPDEKEAQTWHPSHINFYTDTDIWELRCVNGFWNATRHPHIMGMPLMVAMIWNGTSAKPFGRSRIKYPVRALIDGYIRTIANATIALEFDTTPQKYILGVTDEQYDAIVSDKFKQYVGSIIAATQNPETGQNPVFGQLAQGSLAPHVEMIRILATQFSAATGLTVTDTGVVNDANPTSSDAILAQSQTLVCLAEQLNAGNGDALKLIALMALAIAKNVKMGDLTDAESGVVAHFKNPAMPSVSVTADAAIKIASARPEFASTDTFLEMIGFDQADIRRIKAQELRVRGQQVLSEIE
ncbi:MAG: phage portal protein [Bacteroidales bacterium]|nr:phage portal protein [Candidatus Scybalousia scybalohippi]